MYLHIGNNVIIPTRDIVGIFDLDAASFSRNTRIFLEKAEKSGRVKVSGDDLPNSFILCRDGNIYLSQISSVTLKGRTAER